MIIIDITTEQIQLAEKKAKELGELNNSITKGLGNIIGFLGEIIFAEYFNGTLANTYDYDVIVNDYKIDVKSKKTNYPPQENYLATVADFNTKQNCDYYYFVRIDLVNKKGYLLGGLSKKEFYKKSVFYKKDTLDPESTLGWTFKADCYNIRIGDLKQSKKIKK